MKQIIFPWTGNSLLMAIVILTHVFVAFFAVGGLILSLALELVGRHRRDPIRVGFAKKIVDFLSDMMKVNGVLGVAIVVLLIGLWGNFSLWLYNATFWAFLAEGAGFLFLMIFSIAYRKSWDSKPVWLHETYGVLAAFFAVATAFLINGIWSFMLMPGKWLTTRDPLDAFFNPILWPSTIHLLIPTVINAAGILFLYTLWKSKKNAELEVINRFMARTFAILIFLQPLSGLSFLFNLKQAGELYLGTPRPFDQIMHGAARPFFLGMLGCAAIAVIGSLIYWIRRHEKGRVFLVVAVLAAFVAFVMGGYTREKARKPFLIHSFMYMNMQLANAPAASGKRPEKSAALTGAQIFEENSCAVCHSFAGSGGTEGVSLDNLKTKFASIEDLKKYIKNPVSQDMPPDAFTGSDEELDRLAEYLYQ